MADKDALNVDDVSDDAAAAFKEVSERAAAVEPIERPAAEPVTQVAETKEAEKPADEKGTIRDDKGRFASKEAKAESAPVEKNTEKPAAEVVSKQPETPAQSSAAPVAPPPSWSVKAKAAWDALPQPVRDEIAKREGEVSQGLAALRDYKDLKPYADMAAQHGTTIAASLQRYIGLENVLKQDLGQGLAVIAQNYGLSQPQAAQLFATLAQRYGAGVPQAQQNNGALPPNDPLVEALRPILNPIVTELQSVKGQMAARAEADRNASTQSLAKAIEAFSADPANKYFTNLEDQITQLFEKGVVPLTGNHQADLRTAYDLATRMNPEVHEALIEQRLVEAREAERRKEQEAVEKAKQASRSITGSRVPGTVIKEGAREPGGFDDVEDDVRRAYSMHAHA